LQQIKQIEICFLGGQLCVLNDISVSV
jgi:hypothetical protein